MIIGRQCIGLSDPVGAKTIGRPGGTENVFFTKAEPGVVLIPRSPLLYNFLSTGRGEEMYPPHRSVVPIFH